MKKYILGFCRRGFTASGFGPLVLAVLYLVLQHNGIELALTVNQVCLGIFSLSALAFVAGGVNVVYQMEQLPLMAAILIHGVVLYVCYLMVYLLNGWLQEQLISILVFTGIFVAGYAIVWAIIYSVIRYRAWKINALLRSEP